MGKSKRRIIARGKYDRLENLSREDAINFVVANISSKDEAIEIISLFGLKADELLEAGADYEEVKALGSVLK